MSSAKITISIDAQLLDRLDLMVQSHLVRSRSPAIQAAVEEKVSCSRKTRLARECEKLAPEEEHALAEEGLSADAGQWPPY